MCLPHQGEGVIIMFMYVPEIFVFKGKIYVDRLALIDKII